jgi:hypothetical protein
MNSAECSGLPNAARHQRLDARSLDLHVDSGPVADGFERFRKGGNARPVGEREPPELRCRELGDGLMRRALRMPCVDDRVVMNDHNAVSSRVHVELYTVGSELDGALKRGDRVLRMRLVGPPMGDAFGRFMWATCGQAFLPVVALSSMSAKLMGAMVQGQSALTAGGPERLPVEAP